MLDRERYIAKYDIRFRTHYTCSYSNKYVGNEAVFPK